MMRRAIFCFGLVMAVEGLRVACPPRPFRRAISVRMMAAGDDRPPPDSKWAVKSDWKRSSAPLPSTFDEYEASGRAADAVEEVFASAPATEDAPELAEAEAEAEAAAAAEAAAVAEAEALAAAAAEEAAAGEVTEEVEAEGFLAVMEEAAEALNEAAEEAAGALGEAEQAVLDAEEAFAAVCNRQYKCCVSVTDHSICNRHGPLGGVHAFACLLTDGVLVAGGEGGGRRGGHGGGGDRGGRSGGGGCGGGGGRGGGGGEGGR